MEGKPLGNRLISIDEFLRGAKSIARKELTKELGRKPTKKELNKFLALCLLSL